MRASQKVIVSFAAVVGLTIGALAMYAAWDHDPQGEFHATDGSNAIQWRSWLPIGGSWCAAGFAIVFLIGSATEVVVHLIRRRVRRASPPPPAR